MKYSENRVNHEYVAENQKKQNHPSLGEQLEEGVHAWNLRDSMASFLSENWSQFAPLLENEKLSVEDKKLVGDVKKNDPLENGKALERIIATQGRKEMIRETLISGPCFQWMLLFLKADRLKTFAGNAPASDLFQKIERYEQAREWFLNHFIKFAHKPTGHMARKRGVSFRDALGFAKEGIYRAVDNYDPKQGLAFTTYSKKWIVSKLREIPSYRDPFHVPYHWKVRLRSLSRAMNRLSLLSTRQPTFSEIYEELKREEAQKMAKKKKEGGQTGPTDSWWMDHPEGLEQAIELLQRIKKYNSKSKKGIYFEPRSHSPDVEEVLISREFRSGVKAIVLKTMAILGEKEKFILEKRLMAPDGNDMTLEEIANTFKVSRERIRQLEKRVKNKLRQALLDEGYDRRDFI